MTTENENARQDVVRALGADPWYQLSTAGQELFHTNMLYWLAVQRPEESRPVWDLLGVDAPTEGGVDPRGPILREWQHIDLFVDSGMPGRKLVLENKVLAIPTPGQLVGYRSKLQDVMPLSDEVTSWVLLSLMPPAFSLPEPWRYVGYQDLLPALEETANTMVGADRNLLVGYSGLVRRLIDLSAAFDPIGDLDSRVFLNEDDESVLREGRLLSLIRKMQMSRCGELIAQGLGEVLPGPLPAVGAGLTNTQGLVEWFVGAPNGRSFGWQAQGSQLRLVAITGKRDPKNRPRREALIEEQHLDYFDFAVPDALAGLLAPYTGTKSWLGYEPDFVYRYQTLRSDLTWRQFIDLAVWFSCRAHSYAEALKV